MARKGTSTQPLQAAFDSVQVWGDDRSAEPEAPAPPPTVHDSFDGPALASPWAWHAPQAGATYSLTDAPGRLRISLPPGSDNYENMAGVANAPELLRTDLARDWAIQTTLTMAGDQPFNTCCFTAGLSVAFSPDNKFVFGLEHGGNIRVERLSQYQVARPYAATTVDLRIEKTGARYVFKYRPTAAEPWAILATRYATDPVLWVGLMMKSWDTRATGLDAEFDDFELTNSLLQRASAGSAGRQADGSSAALALSADGRVLAFASDADNLVAGDTNGATDIFVFDGHNGTVRRVSVGGAGQQGNSSSMRPAISGDGRYVAFASDADNLVSDDTNGTRDIFVYDRQTGATTRVSVDSAGAEANGASDDPAISGDGRYIAFASDADNLVGDDTNGARDIFVYDRQTGATTRVSRASWGEAYGSSEHPALSADGRYVVFASEASNLVAGDFNGQPDIFLADRQDQQVWRVSQNSAGGSANSGSLAPTISGDGRYVGFVSGADNLVASDTNAVADVFLRDMQSGKIWRLSRSASGAQSMGASATPALSADGAPWPMSRARAIWWPATPTRATMSSWLILPRSTPSLSPSPHRPSAAACRHSTTTTLIWPIRPR